MSVGIRGALLLLAIALGGVLVAQVLGGAGSGEPIEPRRSPLTDLDLSRSLPGLEAAAPPDVSQLRETVERPLFANDRRPRQEDEVVVDAPAPVAAAPVKPPTGTLTAVVITGDDAVAVVRSAEGGVERLRRGDRYQGWEVDRVAPESLYLRRGNVEHELALRQFEAAPRGPVPAPARRAAPARQAPQAAAARPRRPLQGPRARSQQQRQ